MLKCVFDFQVIPNNMWFQKPVSDLGSASGPPDGLVFRPPDRQALTPTTSSDEAIAQLQRLTLPSCACA